MAFISNSQLATNWKPPDIENILPYMTTISLPETLDSRKIFTLNTHIFAPWNVHLLFKCFSQKRLSVSVFKCLSVSVSGRGGKTIRKICSLPSSKPHFFLSNFTKTCFEKPLSCHSKWAAILFINNYSVRPAWVWNQKQSNSFFTAFLGTLGKWCVRPGQLHKLSMIFLLSHPRLRKMR